MAASTALPPRSRICTPAAAARGWLEATTPYFEATTERPGTGAWAADSGEGDAASRTRRAMVMVGSSRWGTPFPWCPFRDSSFTTAFDRPRAVRLWSDLDFRGENHGAGSEGQAAPLGVDAEGAPLREAGPAHHHRRADDDHARVSEEGLPGAAPP